MTKDQVTAIIESIRTTAVFILQNGHKIKQLWQSFDITKAESFSTQIETLVDQYNDAIDEIIEGLE